MTTTTTTTVRRNAGPAPLLLTMRHDGFIVCYWDNAHDAHWQAVDLTARAIAAGDNLTCTVYEVDGAAFREMTA
jgi:hypothetical protein